MTEYFPEEKEDEDATFIVSSFKILQSTPTSGGGEGSVKTSSRVGISLTAKQGRRKVKQQPTWSNYSSVDV